MDGAQIARFGGALVPMRPVSATASGFERGSCRRWLLRSRGLLVSGLIPGHGRLGPGLPPAPGFQPPSTPRFASGLSARQARRPDRDVSPCGWACQIRVPRTGSRGLSTISPPSMPCLLAAWNSRDRPRTRRPRTLAPAQHEDDQHNDHDEHDRPDTDIHQLVPSWRRPQGRDSESGAA